MNILPWVECNEPEHVADTVDGLRSSLAMTDTSIATTAPGQTKLYSEICYRVPRMKLYGGLKTSYWLKDDFASSEAWKEVQRDVVDTIWRTRTRVFVFENESAMRPVWEGTQECSLTRLQESIQAAHFPTNVQYWWYPSVGPWRNSADDPQQDRARDVCRTVQGCFRDIVFLDSATLSGPKSLTWGANLRAGVILRQLAANPPIPILYCYGPTEGWWQDEDLPEALDYVEDGPAILYPGHARFAEVAPEISRLLIEAGLVDRVRGDV